MRKRPHPLHRALYLSLLLACAATAQAHEGHMPAPEQPTGLTFSFGAGLRDLHSDVPQPAPRLPGVLEGGSARADERGTDLDYAELGIGARFNEQLSAQVRYTHHGGEDAHGDFETFWLDARLPRWQLRGRAGRQELPLGFENTVHDHARDFGLAPMALRAAINDAWVADGLRLDWSLPRGFSLGAGAWYNRGYPGVEDGRLNLATLRLGWQNESWKLETGYADARADGRALLTLAQGGHTHSVPSCDTVSADRLCFDGKVKIWSVAARWQPGGQPWWLGGEFWYKHESGLLDSIYGTPDYRGETAGGWLDAGYRIGQDITLIARIESLRMGNEIRGTNAGLIAAQAGLVDADRTPFGLGLVAEWRPHPSLRLLAEWHRDNARGTTDNAVLLRVQILASKTLPLP